MDLKERIVGDHLKALKARDVVSKTVLSVIKSDITSAEKKGETMNDEALSKLLVKMRKNLEESLSAREDETIRGELAIVNSYLPEMMSTEDITTACAGFLAGMPEGLPENAKIGKTMGMFNKTYPGLANPKEVMEIIKSL